MPAGFAYPATSAELWQPLALDRKAPRPRGNHYLRLVARVAADRTMHEATTELASVAHQLQAANPLDYPAGSGFTIRV
jgi:hypothetical protein